MPEPRRFPAPWQGDPMPGGYVVRDANGQALAFVYSRENDGEARQAKVLTKGEARRIAVNIARLPECWGSRVSRLIVAVVRKSDDEIGDFLDRSGKGITE
jgi:hypothetical protein